MILKASSIIMITTVSIVEAVASRLRQYACMATKLSGIQLFQLITREEWCYYSATA